MNILNDISSVYVKEVIEPQLGKKEAPAAAPAGGGVKVEKGKTGIEASAKRIRQAVYDIRYRARREGIELDKAYNQYMSHTTMSGPEKTAVKEKLGIGPGGGSVTEESEQSGSKKFQVRVTDKESGKTYVRYATREKISQLRNNPNISSVEMTQYGKPYEGEKERGEYTAKAKAGKGLDPVGQEDADVNNDGKVDKTDKYLQHRRDVRGAAIEGKKKNVKEGFSNWRQDLHEIMDTLDSPDDVQNKRTQIKENPKIDNKIVINPEFKESIENLGGYLIEMVELDEEFIASSIDVATEYFYEQGLNEEGIDILIEELGVDNFVDFVFEISEEFNLNEARTLLGKKKSPQKLPKGTKPSQATKAAVEKYGTTRTIKSGPSSVIKKKTVAIKKAVEKQPETKTEPKQTKKGILDRVTSAVTSAHQAFQTGMARHKAATATAGRLARETGKTISKAAKGAGHVAGQFGAGAGTVAKASKKALVGEESKLQEVAPPGMEGTVKAMKKHKKEIDNPYALAWWMKSRGYKSHRKASGAMKEAVTTTPQSTQTQSTQQTKPTQSQTQSTQSTQTQQKPDPAIAAKQKQAVALQKQIEMKKLQALSKGIPLAQEEVEIIDERRREDKGTPRAPEPSAAFKAVSASMGASRMGVQPRGVKKQKGAPTPGPTMTPGQQIAKRRAAAQRAQEFMSDTRGT